VKKYEITTLETLLVREIIARLNFITTHPILNKKYEKARNAKEVELSAIK